MSAVVGGVFVIVFVNAVCGVVGQLFAQWRRKRNGAA